jgi:hypothetical protein
LKTTISILCLALIMNFSQAQNVNIPNANFLNALIASGVDTSGDGIIQAAEALAVSQLSIGSLSIGSLTGIEAFTNLTSLACPINALSSIDVSKNTLLEYFDCGGNYSLVTLDLSKNTALKSLDIIFTGLTIDLSHNLLLESLSCSGTIYGSSTLYNKLKTLDVSKNTMLSSLSADMNPQLTKICVNADQFTNRVASWSKDSGCAWDSACVSTNPVVTALPEIGYQKTSPKIIRCFDILGKEIDINTTSYKGILIYLYADGSTKKVVKID